MTQQDASAVPGPQRLRRRLWPALKWSLCLIVVLFVAKRAYDLWQQDDLDSVPLKMEWLISAAVTYLVGWLPSVWFWRKLMTALGGDVRFADAARAYYGGHLGKYVPGKAMVLVIRAAMVRDRGSRATAAALTATYETLLMMGTGLAVGLALLPITGWPKWLSPLAHFPVLPPLAVLAAFLAALPVISKLLTFVAVKMTPREMIETGQTVRIPARLVAAGLLAFVLSWTIHGLSLGLTLQSVSDESFAFSQWPLWIGAVSIATAVGFLMLFAPGGIGVRELLLIEVLGFQAGIGDKQAIAAAVLLRLVWLIAEIAAAAVLYYMVKAKTPARKRSEGGKDQVRSTKD